MGYSLVKCIEFLLLADLIDPLRMDSKSVGPRGSGLIAESVSFCAVVYLKCASGAFLVSCLFSLMNLVATQLRPWPRCS